MLIIFKIPILLTIFRKCLKLRNNEYTPYVFSGMFFFVTIDQKPM